MSKIAGAQNSLFTRFASTHTHTQVKYLIIPRVYRS